MSNIPNLLLSSSLYCYMNNNNEVTIGVKIKNDGNYSLSIKSPLNEMGWTKYDLLLVKKGLLEMPYHGIMLYADKPNTIDLQPTKSYEFDVNIEKEYLLDKSGDYILKLKEEELTGNQDSIVTFANEEIACNLPLNEQFRLFTRAQESEKLSKKIIQSDKFGTHTILNATSVQELNDNKVAHEKAVSALEHIKVSSEYPWPLSWIFDPTFPDSFNEKYQSMFCKKHHDNWGVLIKSYQLMHEYMREGMVYHHHAKGCDNNTYGYVYPASKDKIIYLCPMYQEANVSPSDQYPYDSKAGVILHEVSHKAAGSKDHFYSYKECRDASYKCDSRAVTNADCIQIFAELTLVGKESQSHHDDL